MFASNDSVHMTAIRFDTYYRYDDLVRFLTDWAGTHPGLVRLEPVGKSYEGREIYVVRVTNYKTGLDTDKPALWVDGNIHATEIAGSMACLHLLHRLITGYGKDADITRCLDTRAFYVCPRVNPDGAEWALADVPKLIRSSTRPYPYDEEPIGGLKREDIDGDGRILSMRVPDPNGPWKLCEQDSRILVRRDPVESGGRYYRLLPEGRVEDFDGVNLKLQARKERLDLNRNFPAFWRAEHEQTGAGPFPTSEPEIAAVTGFIARHPNITGAIAFHTYSGVLLRPYSHLADEQMPPEDLWTYQKIGEKGTQITGYPVASAYHEFRYHPKEVITGDFDSWMYDHRGVFAWTVEIWSPQRQAGITDYKYIDWYREHPVEDDLKLMKWNDTALKGQGLRRLVRVRSSATRARGTGRLAESLHLEQSAAASAGKGNRAIFALADLACTDLAETGNPRSKGDAARQGHLARAARAAEHRLVAELRNQDGEEQETRARRGLRNRTAGKGDA